MDREEISSAKINKFQTFFGNGPSHLKSKFTPATLPCLPSEYKKNHRSRHTNKRPFH